ACPRDCAMLDRLMDEAVAFSEGPTVVRYPRGAGPAGLPEPPDSVQPGSGQLLRDGTDLLIVACGVMAGPALEAAADLEAEGRSVAVFDPVWLKPAPEAELVSLAVRCGAVLIAEDGAARGGFGEHVSALLASRHPGIRTSIVAVPDSFQPHAGRERLLASAGLDGPGLAAAARRLLA
ncbi:MAG: transketolase C-terminal domain-containing protein, partial [Candidatus Fermentibacter daniensis]